MSEEPIVRLGTFFEVLKLQKGENLIFIYFWANEGGSIKR